MLCFSLSLLSTVKVATQHCPSGPKKVDGSADSPAQVQHGQCLQGLQPFSGAPSSPGLADPVDRKHLFPHIPIAPQNCCFSLAYP